MTDYLTYDTEIDAVSAAIQKLAGIETSLSYPLGFVDALNSVEPWVYGDCEDIVGSVASATLLASRTTLNATFQANASITLVSFPRVSSITSSRAFRGCGELRGAAFRILPSIPRLTFATCSQLSIVSFPSC